MQKYQQQQKIPKLSQLRVECWDLEGLKSMNTYDMELGVNPKFVLGLLKQFK